MFSGKDFDNMYSPPCTEGEFKFQQIITNKSRVAETLLGSNKTVYTKKKVIVNLRYLDKFQLIEQSKAYTGKVYK